MNIPLLCVLWQHILYLCVRCFWCREVCEHHSQHQRIKKNRRKELQLMQSGFA